MHKFIIKTDDTNRTILKYLIKMLPNIPLSRLHRIFREQDIKVNNKRKITHNYLLKLGDEIIIYGLTDIGKKILPIKTPINFKILFEDKNILVISKKINDEVHGSDQSLDNQVLNYLNYQPISSFIPSHINRLDKPTSGIIVYAKNYASLVQLKSKVNHFVKIYVFKSNFSHNELVKVKLLHNEELQKEVVDNRGKEAITKFWTQNHHNYAQLITGRKHQIRATLAFLKDPIWGDRKYGGKQAKRLYLHATRLIFKSLDQNLEYLNDQIIDDRPDW